MLKRPVSESQRSLEHRLIRHIALDSQTGCWLYNGPLGTNGYKQVWYKTKNYLIHRLAAFLWMGFDLESELKVIHRCNVHCCFNPTHLFIGTTFDKSHDTAAKMRCRNSKKSHCINGHPLSGRNVHVTFDGVHMRRRCLTCHPMLLRWPSYVLEVPPLGQIECRVDQRDLAALAASAEQCLPDDAAIARFMEMIKR